jgi:hypothetical protein
MDSSGHEPGGNVVNAAELPSKMDLLSLNETGPDKPGRGYEDPESEDITQQLFAATRGTQTHQICVVWAKQLTL